MPAPKTFRALRHVPFRWFAVAALTSDTAMWMQRIIQDWLAVKVGGDAGGLAVGVTTALQFLPILIVGPFAGALADRLPRKWLLVMTGLMMAAPSLVLGVIVAFGEVQVWHVYALALVMGVGSGMDTPIRMAYIRDLLDKDDFVNGIGLGMVGFHTARVVGPAVSGALIALAGIATSLFAVTAMYLLAIAALLQTRPPALPDNAQAGAVKPGVADAFGQLRAQPGLLVLMALACVVSSFALNFQVTITLMATQIFQLDAAGFGRLSSMMALGSIFGALLVARLSRPNYVVVFGSAGLLGLAFCLAVGAQSATQFAIALLPIGLLSNLYLASSSAAVQIRTDRRYQGRVAGLYLAVAFALVPLGSVVIGVAADLWSPRGPLAVAGIMCIVAAALTLVALLTLGVVRWRSGRLVEHEPDPQTAPVPALTAG